MRHDSKAVAKYAAIALLFPALLIAGCEKQNKQQNSHQNNPQATQEQLPSGGGKRVRLRVVCADDIQKYCADADKKRRCLKENIDKLSDACKAAVEQRGGGRRARNNDGGDD